MIAEWRGNPSEKETERKGRIVPATLWIISVLALPTVLMLAELTNDHLRQLPAGVWYIPSKVSAKNPVPVTEEHNVAVTHIWGPYRFSFQPVQDDGSLYGHEFTQDICRDYAAPGEDFKVGTILNRLIHTDEGGCWSLNPDKHCGWYKRRDEAKNPIYAKGVVNGN